MTLDKDVSDMEVIERHILQLFEMAGRRLRRGGYAGKTVGIYINNTLAIYMIAEEVLGDIRLKHPIRLVGICVSNLIKNLAQVPLFSADRNKQAVARTMDTIQRPVRRFLHHLEQA